MIDRARLLRNVGKFDSVAAGADLPVARFSVIYANRFHHDTNPAWETEAINDRELHGFVTRTLGFVKR